MIAAAPSWQASLDSEGQRLAHGDSCVPEDSAGERAPRQNQCLSAVFEIEEEEPNLISFYRSSFAEVEVCY